MVIPLRVAEKDEEALWMYKMRTDCISYENHTETSSPLNSKLRQKLDKVIKEIEKINRILYAVESGVSVFGSARELQGSLYYNLAKEVGEVVGRDFWIVTGGGPGLMRAVSESGQKTVGLKMELPFEDEENYANLNLLFHYFFARKLGFITISRGFISLPGGFGTLDETWEVLNLKKEGILDKDVGIVFMDKKFYGGLREILEFSSKKDLMDKEDLELFTIKDFPQDVLFYFRSKSPKKGKKINMNKVLQDIVNIYFLNLEKGITIVGSRKVKKDHPYYIQAQDLGFILGKEFNLFHTGLKGISEAVGRGVKIHKKYRESKCVGVIVRRKFSPSTFMDLTLHLNYFFTQKIAFLKYSDTFIFFPGGFKTLDVLFEVLILMQTRKTREKKVILVDKDYWGKWINWTERTLLKRNYIEEKDLKLFKIVDSNEEIQNILCSSSIIKRLLDVLRKYKRRSIQTRQSNEKYAGKIHYLCNLALQNEKGIIFVIDGYTQVGKSYFSKRLREALIKKAKISRKNILLIEGDRFNKAHLLDIFRRFGYHKKLREVIEQGFVKEKKVVIYEAMEAQRVFSKIYRDFSDKKFFNQNYKKYRNISFWFFGEFNFSFKIK